MVNTIKPQPFPMQPGSTRRAVLLACAAMAGCSAAPPAKPLDPDALLTPWRTVIGGFLSPPGAPFGMLARPGSGAFVKLIAPTAIALRGNDLLIVDSATARVWRFDLGLNTLTPASGVPASLTTTVALGPDQSVWLLDGVARQMLRFARDGTLLQTLRLRSGVLAPAGFALADGAATLLVADDAARQWVEYRSVGAFPVAVRPADGDADPVRGVDALATNGDTVYVLDRKAGAVHVVRRDGQVRASLGAGELKQPVAIAADRFGRVFVHDAQDRTIKLLSPGRPTQVFDAALLRVQQIGGFAVDERHLAVADRLTGQVVIQVLRAEGRP